MKKIIVLFAALILFSCTKEVVKPKPQAIMLDNKPVVTFTEPYYQFDYVNLESLLIKQVNGFNQVTYTITDMSRKIIYLTFTVNTVENKLISSTAPVLPPAVDGTWRKCMLTCIAVAGAFNTCRNEAMIGCLAAWSIYCIWHNYVKTTVYPKITKVYLGPLNP